MARVNLYEEEIENLVQQRGHKCDWYRAVVCHCISRDSMQPDFTCKICGGSGYRYLAPKRIITAVTSLSGKYEQNTQEFREPGTAYATPTKDVIMGYRDRLIFPDFRCTFSEVIQWDFSKDGRGVSPRTYRNIEGVIFLADDKYEYELGVDFEITEDKHHIKWLNKETLNIINETNMSFLYYTTPSYLVDDVLHELRATLSDRKSGGDITFRELPKQYKISRESFVFNISNPEPIPDEEPENPEPDDNPDSYWSSDGGVLIV